MNEDYINYFFEKYPSFYVKNKTQITCDNGWFRPIVWLSRYIDSYYVLQTTAAKHNPNKYLIPDPIIFKKIYEQNAILKFEYDGGNEHLESIISFVEFISGFFCCNCGNITDVCYNTDGILKTLDLTCFNKFASINNIKIYNVDDEKMKMIIKKNNFRY